MKNKKIVTIIIICIVIIIGIIYVIKRNSYNENSEIRIYNLKNERIKNEYLNYLIKKIKPQKLIGFIDNNFIYVDEISSDKTGNDVIEIMKYEGYSRMFSNLFDKNRKSFNDYPVTDRFINKFKNNIFDYYGLNYNNDSIINCICDDENKEIIVTEYSDFKNTESTRQKTYHFHYTLDSEGNVDDVIFDNTSY